MRILVIETAFLGDAVIAIALAEAIRQQDARAEITYLVRPEAADLMAYAPSIDRVITYDKYGTESGLQDIIKKADELNEYDFDVVLSLHTSKRTELLLQKLQARRKIGYGGLSSLTDHIIDQAGVQRSVRAATLARPLYPSADLHALPRIDVSSVTLPQEISATTKPIVAIAPGSVWLTKRWLPQRFAEVATELHRKGNAIAFIGSPSDVGAMKEVSKHLRTEYIDLVGKTTVVEVAAVIARSDMLIANDSAPVHIATAAGKPSVVVFGPTVKEFGFAPPNGIVCETMLWCRPCTSHGSQECPIHTHECMTAISTEQVLAGVGSLKAA